MEPGSSVRKKGLKMSNRLGQQLGSYRLVRLLGQGGFAEVYLGEHIYLGKQTAIKVLYARLAQNDMENFLKEAKTIAGLQHHHIVRILDFGVEVSSPGMEGSAPFLVMDYAPNGTLRQRHPRSVVVPPTVVLSYVKQIASALQYAHDAKVIHRDVKPENLLLGPEQEVLLSDFGTAQIVQTASYQSTRETAGTVAYMAPEQLQGKPRFASDQYALGVLVYEWLSGDRPFYGSFTEVASQHVLVPPPPLYNKVPTLSPAIEEVVMTALNKDPAQRFSSVRAFANAFEQACMLGPSIFSTQIIGVPQTPIPSVPALQLERTPSASPPSSVSIPTPDPAEFGSALKPALPLTPSVDPPMPALPEHVETPAPSQPLIRFKRRFSRRTLLAGLAGLTVVGGGITWWSLLQRPYIGKTIYSYTGHANWISAVAWSPDSRRIASASSDNTLHVWDATTGDHVLKYNGHRVGSSVNGVSWSPDGAHIASAGDDQTVQLWDAVTGKPTLIYQGHASGVISVAWSHDGTRIASADQSGIVQVWSATGTTIYTYKGHTGAVYAVAWSPDGTRIASGGADGKVQVWDASLGITILTYQGLGASIVRSVAWSLNGKYIASGGYDHKVHVWDVTTGRDISQHLHSTSEPNAIANVDTVAWSLPDGQRIASGGGDRKVQIWDWDTGQNIYTYLGHNGYVYTLAWSPNGEYIASGGSDTKVQVWIAT